MLCNIKFCSKKLVIIVGIITRAIVSFTSTTNESKEITTVISPTPSIPWVMPPIKYANKINRKQITNFNRREKKQESNHSIN